MVKVLQVGLVALPCHGIGVVNLRAVNLLERLHGADGTDELKVRVIVQQVTKEIKRQRRNAVWRHKVAHLQAHFLEILLCERGVVGQILIPQHRMLVFRAAVDLVVRHAQADHGQLFEMLLILSRADKRLKQLAVQLSKIRWNAELRLVFVVIQQQHAEVVITHIRREVIANNAFNTLIGFSVKDVGFEHFNRGKSVATAVNIDIHGDDVQLHRVTIAGWVIPTRHGVKTVVDHAKRIAQVLLTALTTSQVGKVGGDARVVRGLVVLVKANAFDRKREIVVHGELVSYFLR